MPKKVTKKVQVAVTSKKQGYWVNKENLHKGERTIRSKGDKSLVKRNRSGYDYSKMITGYEWSKTELQKKLAERSKKGMMEQAAIAKDLSKTHRITKTAPLITAEGFFSRDKWNKQDVLGVDTPPGMSLSEIQEIYKDEKEKPKVVKRKETQVKKVIDKALKADDFEFDPKEFGFKPKTDKPYILTKNADGTLTLVNNKTNKKEVFHDREMFNKMNKSRLKLKAGDIELIDNIPKASKTQLLNYVQDQLVFLHEIVVMVHHIIKN